MYGLMYKELIVNKKQLIFTAVTVLIFTILPFIPDSFSSNDYVNLVPVFICTLIIFLISGMMQQGIYERDESTKWQNYIVSSPNGIKNQISSKYLFTLVFSIATATYCIILFELVCAVHGFESYGLSSMILTLFPFQIFLRSIETPFIICFGSKQGNVIRMVLSGIFIGAIIIYLLFGDLSVFGTTFAEFIQFIINLFAGGTSSKFLNYTLRLSPAVSFVLYFISYQISCRLYMKGGKYYDN